MTTHILSEQGQRDAVTILFARMACHQETPCSVCLKFCRDVITPRAYPILRAAFDSVAKAGDASAGFDMVMMGAAVAAPNPDRPPPDQTTLTLET